MDIKTCISCKHSKSLDQFYKNSRTKDKLTPYCKTCNNLKARTWDALNRGKARGHKFKFKYNLTLDQYNEILNAQNGLCKICLIQPKDVLRVDHDHNTGKVRGLLCRNCNSLLGFAKDNPQILKQAISYLGDTINDREAITTSFHC